MTAAELIEKLRGFDPDMPVRFCMGRRNEFKIISIYAVSRSEARRQGIRATSLITGIWVDLEQKNEN